MSRRRIEIAVKPGSQREEITVDGNGRFVAHLRAPAREGLANEALIRLLAGRLDVPKSSIRIVTPHSRRKLVEIPADADTTRLGEDDRDFSP